MMIPIPHPEPIIMYKVGEFVSLIESLLGIFIIISEFAFKSIEQMSSAGNICVESKYESILKIKVII